MRSSLVVAIAMAACAPALVTPRSSIPLEVWSRPLPAPLAVTAPAPGTPPPLHEYDSTTGYMRRLVTTHAGRYTAWVQKPQISFFALTEGRGSPRYIPASVALLVRTLEPEAVTGPRLLFRCPGRADTLPVAVQSVVARTGNTQSHFLTYLLPTERLAGFASCGEGTLQVGTAVTSFTTAQLSAIRRLLVDLGATAVAPAGQ